MVKEVYNKYDVAQMLYQIQIELNNARIDITSNMPKDQNSRYEKYGEWDGLFKASQIVDKFLEEIENDKCEDTKRVPDEQ